MSTRTAALAVEVASDVAKAVSGLDDVGSAAGGASSDVARMGTEAQDAARKLNLTADSADELGGKAGKATGALGALSSGFELVGAEKYAGALQAAGMATDFMSGVGDSLNLVMESTAVKTALAKVSMAGHAIASGASAAATGVMTGAQWALNAAMSANPIALVVIAVVALTAGIIIAYKKSETFRNIVTGAFSAVKNVATGAFNWIKNNWPLLLAIITGPFGLAVLAVVKKWDEITAGARAAKKFITDKLGELPGDLGRIASKIANVLLAPFQSVLDLIDDILKAIKKIKLPDIPGIPGIRLAGGNAGRSRSAAPPVPINTGPTYNIDITVEGALDGYGVAQQIIELLNRYGLGTSIRLVTT
jgi:phage-related protein